MCAYLIKSNDKEIKEPFARIAIKRFEYDENSFIFLAENIVYGLTDLANELRFTESVISILKQSNELTKNSKNIFYRRDRK